MVCHFRPLFSFLLAMDLVVTGLDLIVSSLGLVMQGHLVGLCTVYFSISFEVNLLICTSKGHFSTMGFLRGDVLWLVTWSLGVNISAFISDSTLSSCALLPAAALALGCLIVFAADVVPVNPDSVLIVTPIWCKSFLCVAGSLH